MDKLKNILSPGHKEDDAKMYDTASSNKQSTAQTGNFAGDTTHSAKNTPGSSHPKPGDDPSKVSEHMPGAFANTPREELSSSSGGLGGSHTTGASSTAHHTANPPHSSTAAPASAAAAAASSGVHSTTTGHSSTHPPHASTAAPASSAAAMGTTPAHTGMAGDDASTSSIKSGIKGGNPSNPLPYPSTGHSSTGASHTGPGSTGQAGSTAVHTTRETIGTGSGSSTVRTTTTTALAPDGTPLHSQTHRERETAPHHGSSTGTSAGHSTTHPSIGTATVPASGSGVGAGGAGHHPHDPSFSNRTLGHDHYGSLDPTTSSTGVGSLGNSGRDATTGLGAGSAAGNATSRPHGPHQETHPIKPGTGAGVGGTGSASHTTALPDRSRGVINEPGTQAAVGETSTYSSFPVGGEHVSGPHKTATANILDPHVPQSGVASKLATPSPPHQTSSTHHGSGLAGTAGAAAIGAGGASAFEHGKTSNTGAPSRQDVASQGGSTGVPGAGVTPGHHAQQTKPESAAQKSITGDHSHSTEHKTTGHTAGAGVLPSGQRSHQAHQHPSETGPQASVTGDQSKRHTSRDTTTSDTAGGATRGTSGHEAGHTPLAGTDEGRQAPLGEHVDKGPASKTMGPHSSNILNILDPRVKPDPAVQGSEKTNKIDPRVEGPTGASGTHASGDKHRDTSDSYGTDRHASSGTHTKGTDHTDSQRLASDYAKHGDTTTKGSHGQSGGAEGLGQDSSHGQDSGRHGISSLLHRDNPSKLHKDPPK